MLSTADIDVIVWRNFSILSPKLVLAYAEDILRGVEWVHGLFLFPLVLGKM